MYKAKTKHTLYTTEQNGYWRNLNIANAAMTSSTAPTQSGVNIQAVVPGGVTTAYPGDGIWATWALKDVFDVQVNLAVGSWVNTLCRFIEITQPALTTNSYAYCGIVNNADLNDITCAGYGGGAHYAGDSRAFTFITIGAGEIFATVSSAAAGTYSTSNLAFYEMSAAVTTNVVTLGSRGGFSLTSDGAFTSNEVTPIALESPNDYGTTNMGRSDLYFFMGFGRTATTAGDATIIVKPEAFAIKLPILI